MPRHARLDAPGTLHHVMGRGIERTDIFRNRFDRKDFIERLAELCREGYFAVYAWALMSNHFHLLIRTKDRPLSTGMRKLLTGYVINFNRRHKRFGHLFQNRYKSIVCEDDPYLLELTRYIHLNPLRKKMVPGMEELKKYPWTGHSAIMGDVKRDWQDSDAILSYFSPKKKRALLLYEQFLSEGIALGKRPELVGGGLIRSLGGWSAVLSLRRKDTRTASDERILGSSEFILDLFSEAEQKAKETLRLSGKVKALTELADETSKEAGITVTELRSGGRQRRISKARRLFCQTAVSEIRYQEAEVARFLGVTTSAVCRLANSEEETK
jgi:REP-associated tyrosine transposase